jgi:prophage DNA circulation protein
MDQLNWHVRQVNKANTERTRLYWFILIAGGLGSVLAALGGTFSLWVALTASLTSALIGWQQLRDRDTIVRNYSKVVMELTILSEHWNNLEPEERTDAEFFNMVNSTEDILWSQNVEYIKAMQEALTDASLEKEASLIHRVIQESVEADARFKKSLEDSLVNYAADSMTESQKALADRYQKTLGTLSEEASSELVQAELAAMGQAVSQAAQIIAARAAGLSGKLKDIAEEFSEVEIGKDTPMSVLNAILERYPISGEIKG